MRIESVEAFPISMRALEKLRAGTFSYAQYQTVLVKAVCDGVAGWGEAMTRFDPASTALLVRFLSKSIGRTDAGEPSTAWRRIWRELRIRGHTRGTAVEALSGIEMALYDCYGRLKHRPISKLLSGEAKSKVSVYAGSLFSSRSSLESQVESAKAAGMKGTKVKIGFGFDKDRRTLEKVRRLWPDGMLVADANGAFDARTALKACSAFRNLELAWFEEPVLSDDWEGYRSLKNKGVRIGAGEAWFKGDLAAAAKERLVDVLEPSVSRCGGVGVLCEVAGDAAKRGLGFSPMTGMNSAVSLVASLHVAAAFSSLGVEANPFPNPLQTELASELPRARNGMMDVPSVDGLGIDIDEGFVKRHSN